MSALPPPAKGSSLPIEELDRRLMALVIHGGNTTQAAKALGIKQATIASTMRAQSERYYAMYEREAPKVERRLAAEAERLIGKSMEVLELALDKTKQALNDGERSDQLSGTARNLAVVSMGLNDKVTGPNRGRATQTIKVERHDTHELFASIQRSFPGALIVEGSATEETPDEPGPQTNGSEEES